MALAFNSIVAAVREHYSGLALSNPYFAQVLRVYESVGINSRKWKTTGIYATACNNTLFVLEVFFQSADNVCVVRVYKDTPLTFYYARKTSGELEAASTLVGEAATIFRDIVPLNAKSTSETEVLEVLPK